MIMYDSQKEETILKTKWKNVKISKIKNIQDRLCMKK